MLSMSFTSAFRALLYVVSMWPDRHFRNMVIAHQERANPHTVVNVLVRGEWVRETRVVIVA